MGTEIKSINTFSSRHTIYRYEMHKKHCRNSLLLHSSSMEESDINEITAFSGHTYTQPPLRLT